MISQITRANAPRVLGLAGILGGVVIAGGAATMPTPPPTQIEGLPEPEGAFGPVFLFGSIPLYDVLDPPEPGGAFGQAGVRSSREGRAPSRRGSTADDAASSRSPEPKSTSSAFNSNLSMIENYAQAGLCDRAADYARKCLDGFDDSITASQPLRCVEALGPCRDERRTDQLRKRACQLILERHPGSREAVLAIVELDE
jgi:hypothetical protein